MAYLLGEEIQLGAAIESTRGTGVVPAIWFPARKPTTIVQMLNKTTIKETRGTGIDTDYAEIVQSRAQGDVEFNIRNTSIGYFLKSLLGSASVVVANSASTHTFTRLATSPQNPSLTLAYAAPNQQDYWYPLTVVDQLDITVGLNDLAFATAKFVAASEATHADFTPAFTETNDNYFRPQDVSVKIAPTLAGVNGTLTATGVATSTTHVTGLSISTTLLSVGMGVTGTNIPAGTTISLIVSASAFDLSAATTGAATTYAFVPITINIQDLKLSIAGNTQLHQTIGNVNPSDVLSLAMGITGSLSADYDGSANFYTAFTSNTTNAMLIDFQRTDLAVLGTSALKPRMTITLPKITYSNYTPNRPINDIVHEGINFVAHYSTADTAAITVTLQNVKADYVT